MSTLLRVEMITWETLMPNTSSSMWICKNQSLAYYKIAVITEVVYNQTPYRDIRVAMLYPAFSRVLDRPYSPPTTIPVSSSQSLHVRLWKTPLSISSSRLAKSIEKAQDSTCRDKKVSRMHSYLVTATHIPGCQKFKSLSVYATPRVR